jgi:hypothetical protein
MLHFGSNATGTVSPFHIICSNQADLEIEAAHCSEFESFFQANSSSAADSTSPGFSKSLDFTCHIECVLLNKCPLDESLLIDTTTPEFAYSLGGCPRRASPDTRLNRVEKILNLIDSDLTRSRECKEKLIKLLIAWESQFGGNLKLILRLIQKSSHFSDSVHTIASYRRDDEVNTLHLSVNSCSCELVQMLVEKHGASVNLTNVDLFKTTRKAIHLNEPALTAYLTARFAAQLTDFSNHLIDASIYNFKTSTSIIATLLSSFSNIDTSRLIGIVKYLYLSLMASNEIAYDVLTLIVEKFQLDLSQPVFNNNRTVFSLCLDFANEKLAKYLLRTLASQQQPRTQMLLVHTILVELDSPPFVQHLQVLECLLNSVNDKRELYRELLAYKNVCKIELYVKLVLPINLYIKLYCLLNRASCSFPARMISRRVRPVFTLLNSSCWLSLMFCQRSGDSTVCLNSPYSGRCIVPITEEEKEEPPVVMFRPRPPLDMSRSMSCSIWRTRISPICL